MNTPLQTRAYRIAYRNFEESHESLWVTLAPHQQWVLPLGLTELISRCTERCHSNTEYPPTPLFTSLPQNTTYKTSGHHHLHHVVSSPGLPCI